MYNVIAIIHKIHHDYTNIQLDINIGERYETERKSMCYVLESPNHI